MFVFGFVVEDAAEIGYFIEKVLFVAPLGVSQAPGKHFSTLNSGFKQNFSQFSCKLFGLASGDPVVAAEGHSRERNVLDRVHGVVQRCNQRIESETLVAFSCQKNQGTHSSKVDNAPHHSLEIIL